MWCLLMGPAKIISLRSVEGLLKLMQILRPKIFFFIRKSKVLNFTKSLPFSKRKTDVDQYGGWRFFIFYFLFIYLTKVGKWANKQLIML